MLLRLALTLTLITPLMHIAVLLSSELTVHDPISVLSQSQWGMLHTVGLLAFVAAHGLLALTLGSRDSGWFWPIGRGLLVAAGVNLVYVSYYFAATPAAVLLAPGANDPLWLVATLIGFAMGLLQPGFSRLSPALGHFNLCCLAAWILLIPATLLIGVISLGVYERVVGGVYLAWIGCILITLLRHERRDSPSAR
ncbi:MAG: hypothetical protein AAGI24_03100 [Pseudomonadota bacterium]